MSRHCHGCTKRYVTKGYNCHMDCPDYDKDVEADAEKNRLIRKIKDEENAVWEVRNRSFEKHKSKKHGGKKQ